MQIFVAKNALTINAWHIPKLASKINIIGHNLLFQLLWRLNASKILLVATVSQHILI